MVAYSYDHNSNLLHVDDGATPLAYFEYTRGNGGLITSLYHATADLTAVYEYDVNNRLQKEVWFKGKDGRWGYGLWGQFGWGGSPYYLYDYAYDKAGNRTRHRTAPSGQWTYFSYANDNSLTKSFLADLSSATYYNYDQSGSCTKIYSPSGTAYFEYTAANLPKKVAIKDGSTYQFAYDGNLQRYKITTGGTDKYYVWDGLRLLELRASDGSLIARYTHGAANIEGIGSCVEVYDAGLYTGSPTRYYLLYDHRGTVHVLLDENKTVIARRRYNAFGETIEETGTWPDVVMFAYQSNWMKLCSLPDGSPLYLSPTRLYHAGTGRFLQRDLIHRPTAPSSYIYATNSPPSRMDPVGLEDYTIEIFIDKSTKPWEFDVKGVQKRLQDVVDKCSKLVKCTKEGSVSDHPLPKVNVIMKETDGMPSDLGPQTSSSVTSVLSWYDKLNPLWYAWAVGYDLTGRYPTGYGHYVRFSGNKPVTPVGHVLAMTGHYYHMTNFLVNEITDNMGNFVSSSEITKLASWDQIYANLLAHEVFHIGLLGAWDELGPTGHIVTKGGSLIDPVKIDEEWCTRFYNKILSG